MVVFHWLLEHWDSIVSNGGIIGGLLFTAFSMRSEAKTRRIANLLTVTGNHREIWKELHNHPELGRVLESHPKTSKHPVTPREEVFVNSVILHLASVFYALNDDLMIKEDGLRRDVYTFFTRPIPGIVWEKMKVLHNDQFVAFVESCRNWK